MGRKRKSLDERSVRVNISLNPKTLEAIDTNVEKMQRFLMLKGIPEADVLKAVSRSSLLKELISTLATDAGLFAIQTGFAAAFGFDASQMDLFGND